jgi:hypothetical protein
VRERLAALPRVPLAPLPTPLDEAPRLARALTGAPAVPRILIKRDDLTGLAMGGNKVRKLEYHLGEALAQECDTLVTPGAIQSNHCRVTAAAARKAGLDAVLILRPGESAAVQGNLLLDHLLGARVRIASQADRGGAGRVWRDIRGSHPGVPGGDAPERTCRGPPPRSGVYRKGYGGIDRSHPAGPVARRSDRGLLAHRRPAGPLRLCGPLRPGGLIDPHLGDCYS